MTLDHFVLYSSAASMLWSPGQVNYAAANSFLDALAHYRRDRGLPGLAINWGAFAEVGMAAEAIRNEKLIARGSQSMRPEQGHEVLARLLSDATHARVGVIPIDVRQWVSAFPRAVASPTISELLKGGQREARDGASIVETLKSASPGSRTRLLAEFVIEQMALVSRLDVSRVEPTTPLSELGLDSLMALELRNRLEGGTGIRLSATLLWTYPNAGALAEYVLGELDLSDGADAASGGGQPQELPDSEEAMAALLEEQMASLEGDA